MIKFILIPIAILGIVVIGVLVIAVIETNYHKRKNRNQREKDDANIHSKRQIEYYKGENKPKPEHNWIGFNLN